MTGNRIVLSDLEVKKRSDVPPLATTRVGQRTGWRPGELPNVYFSADGVEGEIFNEAIVTIKANPGESFGGAPKIFNFEDFRGGALLPSESHIENSHERLKGDYYSVNGHYYKEDYRSSGCSAILTKYSSGQSKSTRLRMTTDEGNNPDNPNQEFYTESFISYALKCPGGYLPFGQVVSEPSFKQFDSGSDFKITWLMQGARGDGANSGAFGGNDVCVPTNVGMALRNAGNNGGRRTPSYPDEIRQNWCWDEWARLTVWMSDITGQHYVRYEMPGGHVYTTKGPMEMPLNALGEGNGMNVLSVYGWLRRNSQEGMLILMDDIYWSNGANSSSRVEILNSEDYNTSDNCSICDVLEWSEEEITVRVLFGPNGNDDVKRLAVITEGDNVITSRELQVASNG